MSSEMDQEPGDRMRPGSELSGDLVPQVSGNKSSSSDAQHITLTPTNAEDQVICEAQRCSGTHPKYMFARNSRTNKLQCKKTRLEDCVNQERRALKSLDVQDGVAQRTIIADLTQANKTWRNSLAQIGVLVPDTVLEDLDSAIEYFVMAKAVPAPAPTKAANDVKKSDISQYVLKEWRCLSVGPMDCPAGKCLTQRCVKCKVTRPLCFFLRENYTWADRDIFCRAYHKVRDHWKGNECDFKRLQNLRREVAIRKVTQDIESHISEWRYRVSNHHHKDFSDEAWSPVMERVEDGSAILAGIWFQDPSKANEGDDKCESHDSMSVGAGAAQPQTNTPIDREPTHSSQSPPKRSSSTKLVIAEPPQPSPRQRERRSVHLKDVDYTSDLDSHLNAPPMPTGSSHYASRSSIRDTTSLVQHTRSSDMTPSQEDVESDFDDSRAVIDRSAAPAHSELSTNVEEVDPVTQQVTASENKISLETSSKISPDVSSNITASDALVQGPNLVENMNLEVAKFEKVCSEQPDDLSKLGERCAAAESKIHRLEEELAQARQMHQTLLTQQKDAAESFHTKKLAMRVTLEKRVNEFTSGQLQALHEVQSGGTSLHIALLIQQKKDRREEWLRRIREATI